METKETQQQQPRERYPIGVQTFADIIEGGYTYADKTGYIHRLIEDGGKYYFLARPRRFGKSLFLSTLESFFEGRRELFRGLEIDRLERGWTPSPVLHFDLNSEEYSTPDGLRNFLLLQLRKHEEKSDIKCEAQTPASRLGELLWRLCEKTGRRVVVLIDEYDKPLVNNFDNEALADAYRAILKGFYGNLKSGDRYIRFAMLTGVTRFSKVSIFSDVNNLDDISMDRRYACICGITQGELIKNFPLGIRNIGEANGMDRDRALEELRACYDGYHFAPSSEGVYNPYSLLKAFSKQDFGQYWYSSATTTMLARRVRSDRWNLPELQDAMATASSLADIDSFRDPVPLLYQTGYLTIKDFDPRTREYTLGYPNREVRQGFEEALCKTYVGEGGASPFDVYSFRRDVERGRTDEFMRRLCSLFASFPYDDTAKGGEYWFRSVIYTVFMMVGQLVRVEYHSAYGRSDLEVFTDHKIYIFEFKYGSDTTPSGAISQIIEKGYAAPYACDLREKLLIGAVYRTDTRALEWEAKTAEG